MLILAATPIGNLEDASERLRKTLADCDHLYAEDTRNSARLLKHLGIDRPLSSFHEHSPPAIRERIGRQLEDGADVAYISDAGMPGINDPGYELVQLAYDREIEVDVIPGPTAVINALVLSGLPSHAFCFLGFFPNTLEKRKTMLQRLLNIQMTAVFFEGPSRVLQTLAFLKEHAPQTPIAICREMTKLHQQVIRGLPVEVAEKLEVIKGEFVLVIGPVVVPAKTEDLSERYHALLDEGHSPNRAIKILAGEHRLPKREIYKKVHGEA